MYPFTQGSFAPRNGWYVAAFCEEVGDAIQRGYRTITFGDDGKSTIIPSQNTVPRN